MGLFQDLVRQERVNQGTPALQNIAAKYPDALKAWQDRAVQADYALGSSSERAAVEKQFAAEYPEGQGIINHYQGPSRGSAENFKNLAIESFLSAKDAMRLSDDVAKGRIDANTAAVLSKNAERKQEQYIPEALQVTHDTIGNIQQRWADASGIVEGTGAVAQGFVDSAKELFTNPEGVMQLATESSGNMLPSMAGAITGAKVGTAIAPGTGTAAGAVVGFIGSLMGGLSTEAGARLIEEAGQEIHRLGLEPTEANYAAVLANEEFKNPAISKSRRKAIGTAAVDAVLSVAAAKIATAPLRAAQKEARLILGADAPQEVVDSLTKVKLAEKSFSSKLAANTKAYGAEVISEPISELTGQLNAGDDVNLGELAGELLGGVGTSLISKQVDTAVFGTKLATAATAATAQAAPGIVKKAMNAVTETVADVTAKKTPFKAQMDELHKGNAAFDYDNKVKAVAATGDVSEYTDTAKDTYNPSLAVDALIAINSAPDTDIETKAANIEQASAIVNTFAAEKNARDELREELETKNKDKSIAKNEQIILRDLRKIAAKDKQYLTNLHAAVSVLDQNNQSADETQSQVETAKTVAETATTPEESVTLLKQVFGSNGGSTISSLGSSLETMRKHPATSPETASFIKTIQDFSAARINLAKSYSSTTEQVHTDVLKGGDGYRSVDSYTKNIATALEEGKDTFAVKELTTLSSFAKQHREKADVLRKVTEAVRNGTPVPGDIQARFNAINKTRVENSGGKLKPYKIHQGSIASGVWDRTLTNMEKEADTLDKGVAVASGLFGLYQKKAPVMPTVASVSTKDTTTPVSKTNAATSQPEASAGKTDKVHESVTPISDMADKHLNERVQKENKEYLDANSDEEAYHVSLLASVETRQQPSTDKTPDASDTSAPTGVTSKQQPAQHKSTNGKPEANKQKNQVKQTNSPAESKPTNKSVPSTKKQNTESKTQTKEQKNEDQREMRREEIREGAKKPEEVKTKTTIEAKLERVSKHIVKLETDLADAQKAGDNITAALITAALKAEYPVLARLTSKAKSKAKADKVKTDTSNKTASEIESTQNSNDYRKINLVQKFVKKSASTKVTLGKFFTSVKEALVEADLSKLFSTDEKFNSEHTSALLGSMNKFHTRMSPIITELFRPMVGTSSDYKYKDLLQDIAVDGIIPDDVKEAMTAVMYRWLATRSTETLFNDEKTIRKILGLKDTQVISDTAYTLLSEIGVMQDILADGLGKDMYRLLGYFVDKNAPADTKQRIQKALGLYSLAVMEHAKILKVNQVYSGRLNKEYEKSSNTFGLGGLKASILNDNPDIEIDLTSADSFFPGVYASGKAIPNTKGKTMVKFYQLNTGAPSISELRKTYDQKGVTSSFSKYFKRNSAKGRSKEGFLQPQEDITTMSDLWNKSRDTWDLLFTADPDRPSYSWIPFKTGKGKRSKVERTRQYATENQTKNQDNNSNKPWKESPYLAPLYHMLDEHSQLLINGYTDPDSVHVAKRKGITSKNNGIIRERDSLHNWIADANTQPNGRKSLFYIPAKIVRQMRMHQQGDISPQANNLHTFYFFMDKWETEVDISKTDTLTKKEAKFLLAVGLGLGVEAGKVGGFNSTLQALTVRLQDATIVDAVAALREVMAAGIDETKRISPELTARILAGVAEGGEDMHSFKSLVEYARYQEAKETGAKFVSDIFYEIDGKTNGAVIAKLQMMFTADMNTIAMLRNAGITTSDEQQELGEHLLDRASLDIYERVGSLMNSSIQDKLQVLLAEFKSIKNKHTTRAVAIKQEISRITASTRIFGELNDKEGYITKVVRKLTKNPTTKTMYGAGKLSLSRGLSEALVDDYIYGTLEKISNMGKDDHDHTGRKAAEALAELKRNIDILANLPKGTQAKHYFTIPENAVVNGIPNKEVILNITIPAKALKNIHDAITTGYGDAIADAIDATFSDVIEGRNLINKGYSVVAALYNVAYNKTVSDRKAELITAGKLPVVLVENGVTTYADLSTAEYEAINEKLDALYPTINTPFEGGVMDMAKAAKDKNYTGDVGIKQSYGPPRAAGYPQSKTAYTVNDHLLQSPGVSSTVMAVQMLDATVSNLTQARDIDLLNKHDGFPVGLDQVEQVNKALNENLIQVMNDYDLVQEAYNGITRSIDAFDALVKENQWNDQEMDEAVIAQMKAFKLSHYMNSNTGSVNMFESNPDRAIENILSNLEELAQQALENKTKFIYLFVTNVNNYYYPGGGFSSNPVVKEIVNEVASVDAQEQLNNLDQTDRDKAIKLAAKTSELQERNTNEIQELFLDYVTNVFNKNNKPESVLVNKKATKIAGSSNQVGIASVALDSSGNTYVSENETDYDPAIEVTQQNAVDTYNMIKDAGTVKITTDPVHDSHLQKILSDIVSGVLNPASVFLKTHSTNDETAGKFVTKAGEKDKVFITSQDIPASGMLAQGIRMSTGEVYAHELVHAITHSGLKIHHRLRRQVEILYRLAKQSLDKDGKGFIHFLSDPALDLNDPANAQEIADAKHRWERIFGDAISTVTVTRRDTATELIKEKVYSTHLDEFMAYGLTNASFIRALTPLLITDYRGQLFKSDSWKNIISTNIQTTMVNIMNRITDMFMHSFTSQRPADNIAAELERLAQRLATIDSNNKSMALDILRKIELKESALGKYIDKKIKGVFNKLNFVVGAKYMINEAKNKNTALGQALRTYQQKLDTMDHGILMSIFTQVKGYTERVAPLHDLINTRYQFIDRAQNEASTNMIGALTGIWKRTLTSKEKIALMKVALKTDLTALREHFSMEEITALVNPVKASTSATAPLDQAITSIQSQLKADPALKDYAIYYMKQSQSLGVFMVHSEVTEEVSLLNAHVIAGLHNTKHSGKLSASEITRATSMVDQLATLYALQFSSIEHRSTLYSLLREDVDAVEKVLSIHSDLQAEALTRLFNDNPSKIMKGYTADITNPYTQIRVGTLQDKQEFAREGYTINDRAIPRDPRDKDKNIPMYLYTARTGATNTLAASIFSFTRNRAKGTNPFQNSVNQGLASVDGVYNHKHILKAKSTALDDMFTTPFVPYDPLAPGHNYMVPKLDDKGNIAGYRYMMKEHTKDTLLEKNNEYDAVLGTMAGRSINKQRTNAINRKGIQALYDMYLAEYTERPNLYIEVSPFADDAWAREIYHLLPISARQDMQEIWGDQKMYVARDVMDMVFGTRKYSITEAFNKSASDRHLLEKSIISFAQFFFKDKALTRLSQIEGALITLTKVAKNNMIVKGFTTTLNNHLSNLVYCRGRGVSMSNVLKWKREFISGSLQYMADHKALAEAKIQLTASEGRKATATLTQDMIDKENKRLKAIIREKNNSIALNPVTDAMDSGIMQSIVDDVDTTHHMTPYLSDLEKFEDKALNMLPEKVANLGKVVFLAEDTQLYKVLNNATKMTDGIGRYIMYKHYTGLSKKDGGLAHKEAIAKVLHEFVNYNIPANRMLDYLNATGFIWFSKYALGILKPIKDMIQDKPFAALFSMTMAGIGDVSNVGQAIPFINKDVIGMVDNAANKYVEVADNLITIKVAKDILGVAF